jgi:SAM-dependent methyltransferase
MVEGIDRSLILDIGCGDGSMSLPLLEAGGRLTLLDFSAAMLERAKRNIPRPLEPRVEIVCGDLIQFSPAQRYTLVLCLGVLAHVPDVGEALAKIASLLGEGGHCLLQITDASRWLGRLNYAYYDWRSRGRPSQGYPLNRLASGRLTADADALGLRLVKCRNYSLSIPGLRRLPDEVQFRLERRFLSSRFSRHGGESLLLLKRT